LGDQPRGTPPRDLHWGPPWGNILLEPTLWDHPLVTPLADAFWGARFVTPLGAPNMGIPVVRPPVVSPCGTPLR
jgi:hypothetical protein